MKYITSKPVNGLKFNKYPLIKRRFYSTQITPKNNNNLPTPILTIKNLELDSPKKYRHILKNKGGIYCIFNTITNKRYIGSAKDFFLRLTEHLANKKSNIALQNSISKYGLDKFDFHVYEHFTYINKILNHKILTELETIYLKKFDLDELYNYSDEAISNKGYKHTELAIDKMKTRYKDKSNHPMYGKSHKKESLDLISKPGILNPMYGKKHTDKSKSLISKSKNKHKLGVGIFDINSNLIAKFDNNVELAKHLNISKVTVGKYMNKGKIYDDKYIFKPIES